MNNLYVSNHNVESYIDDTKSFISFSLSEVDFSLLCLYQDLRNNTENSAACSNKLLTNPTKTKQMIFGMKKSIKNLSKLTIPFLGKMFRKIPVTVCEDLGLTLDDTLTLDDHIQERN